MLESQVYGGNVELQERRPHRKLGTSQWKRLLCEVKGFNMPLLVPVPVSQFPECNLFLNACLLGFSCADWSNLWVKKTSGKQSGFLLKMQVDFNRSERLECGWEKGRVEGQTTVFEKRRGDSMAGRWPRKWHSRVIDGTRGALGFFFFFAFLRVFRRGLSYFPFVFFLDVRVEFLLNIVPWLDWVQNSPVSFGLSLYYT